MSTPRASSANDVKTVLETVRNALLTANVPPAERIASAVAVLDVAAALLDNLVNNESERLSPGFRPDVSSIE